MICELKKPIRIPALNPGENISRGRTSFLWNFRLKNKKYVHTMRLWNNGHPFRVGICYYFLPKKNNPNPERRHPDELYRS